MSILIDKDTRLCVSGITGREGTFHALNNKRYGTNVVAGVTPGKGGQDVEGTPVFDTIKEAVDEAGANTSMVFVPAKFAAAAINEAIRDWVATVDHTAYLFGTAAGPHPFPSMVRDFCRGIGDEARGVLSFPPAIAPTKVLLVPLSTHASFKPLTQDLTSKLRRLGISTRVDDSSASIGKRYARNDELGTPLGITVDFQSVKDGTFTLRDRDSTKQVRAGEAEILAAVRALVEGEETWEDVRARLPEFLGQEVD